MRINRAWAVACGSILLASPAWAAFEDDLESSTVGGAPAGTQTNPAAVQPDTWFAYSGYANGSVTDAATPGAPQGSQYFQLTRSGADVAYGAVFGTQTGGTVNASWLMYVPTGSSTLVYLTENTDNADGVGFGLGTTSALLTIDAGNGALRYYSNNFTPSDNLSAPSVTFDVWQQWTLTADLDNQQAVITIDGVSSSPFAFNTDTDSAKALAFKPADGATIYIDNVVIPEPATFGLLAAGIAACGMRRGRRGL